jgi:hypothetical protein
LHPSERGDQPGRPDATTIATNRRTTMPDDAKAIRDEFRDAVNMTAKELAAWLDTDDSKAVGQKEEGGESVGHRYGRRIVELLGTKAGDLGEQDLDDMRKVTGYVHRHLAQRPDGDVSHTPWRYSLMNWGHDPLKQG